MAECKVWLDNYHTGYYYPGSQIQGRIAVTFNSDTKFKNIKLRLFGHEHTEWMGSERYTDTRTRKRRSRSVLKTGNNDFLYNEIIVYGTDGSGTISLPAGQHIYPFSLTLPYNIPGTYNCEFGSISYKLEAIVNRKLAFDYKDELIFVVVTVVDLNALQTPELLEPTSYSNNKTLYCCCCSQGQIEMDVHLPKKTLIPQETVNVTVRLSNLSKKNIDGLELLLKQRITCKVDDFSETDKRITNTLVHLKEGGLGAHGQHTYTLYVKLPSNASLPNFSMCKLFKLNYHYTVAAKLPGAHINLKIKMFPELGHVDIGQNMAGNYPYLVQTGTQMPYIGQPSSSSVPHGQGYYPPPPQGNPKTTTIESTSNPSAPLRVPEDLPPSYDSINPPLKY